MGKQLTDSQKNYLKSIRSGGGFIPAITFAALRDAGLAEKADLPEGVGSAGRGKTYAIATPAGINAVSGVV